jgi:small-conductance mechanosensitive channel
MKEWPEGEERESERRRREQAESEERKSIDALQRAARAARANSDTERYFSDRESEFLSYRNLIANQEQELEAYRAKLKKEQFDYEKKLRQEFDKREKLVVERERQLLEKQSEISTKAIQQQIELDEARKALEEESNIRSAQFREALAQLQQEKDKYNETTRLKIEKTSNDYVSEALAILEKKEEQYHFISKVWSSIGAVSLGTGFLFFGWLTVTSLITFPATVTWEFIVFSLFKGVVGITFAAGLAKYAFLFSSSYMREALKNADRSHAINFGKFYLKSYGAAAEWAQVKEAFEHWNISGENAFSPRVDNGIDVSSLEKAASIIEKALKILPEQEVKKS